MHNQKHKSWSIGELRRHGLVNPLFPCQAGCALLQNQAAMARVSLTANLDRDCKTCIKLKPMQVLERPVKRLEKMRSCQLYHMHVTGRRT